MSTVALRVLCLMVIVTSCDSGEEIADAAPDQLDAGCPISLRAGSTCDHEGTCAYGWESCAGETFAQTECSCTAGTWQCVPTNACPDIDAGGSTGCDDAREGGRCDWPVGLYCEYGDECGRGETFCICSSNVVACGATDACLNTDAGLDADE